jgi:hypothetical protein
VLINQVAFPIENSHVEQFTERLRGLGQVRNPFEQALIEPILRTLADPAKHGLGAEEGQGIVVPHRAQRAALQQSFPQLCILDPASGLPGRSAIDTVERFQGGGPAP